MNALQIERNERKEIFYMLGKLTPGQRVAFLHWCCRQASLGDHVSETRVTKTDGGLQSVYWDIMLLGHQHAVDLEEVAEKLGEVLKQFGY